jgi:hypothetical protein
MARRAEVEDVIVARFAHRTYVNENLVRIYERDGLAASTANLTGYGFVIAERLAEMSFCPEAICAVVGVSVKTLAQVQLGPATSEVARTLFLITEAERIVKRRRMKRANPQARLRNAVDARLWQSLKGIGGASKLFQRLGYSCKDLAVHLERLFLPGMTWENYGKWHVDHKKPCAAFDLTDPQQFTECWRLENLQPLWARDNISKGAKWQESLSA